MCWFGYSDDRDSDADYNLYRTNCTLDYNYNNETSGEKVMISCLCERQKANGNKNCDSNAYIENVQPILSYFRWIGDFFKI